MQRLIVSCLLWFATGLSAESSALAMHPCEELLGLMRGDSVELFIKGVFIEGGEFRTERILVFNPSLSGRAIRAIGTGRPEYYSPEYYSEDTIDFPLTLRLAHLKRHPLFKVPSNTVQAGLPDSIDMSATLGSDGYQILTHFRKIDSNGEKAIFDEFLRKIGRTEITLIRFKRKWFRQVETKFYGAKLVLVGERFPLSNELRLHLDERMDFLGTDGLVTVRNGLGAELVPTFHYDFGRSVLLAEALNLGSDAQGTFAVGKSKNVFELQSGQVLQFAGDEHPTITPLLHSAPPRIGDRTFLRYTSTEISMEIFNARAK